MIEPASAIAIVGIDLRDSVHYVARVHHSSGRPEVKALARFETCHLAGHHLTRNSRAMLSIPDRLVRIRHVQAEPSEVFADRDRVAFELLQSQLEPEDDFRFDSLPIDESGRHLGISVRRQTLTRVLECLGDSAAAQSPGFMVRAEALGRGYLSFCRAVGGEFVCVADIAGGRFSVCFVFGHRVVGLARVDCAGADENNPADAERLALEFRMVVNYHLAALREQGVSLPLSALVLCGLPDHGSLTAAIQKYFPMEVAVPQLHGGFFADSTRISLLRLDKYLVALGLTVPSSRSSN